MYTAIILLLAVLTSPISAANTGSLKVCAKEKVTKGFFFDIVNVKVLLPECKSASIFNAPNKAISFEYLREISAQDFRDGAIEYIEKNTTLIERQPCLKLFKDLNASYKSTNNGDSYLFVFGSDGKFEVFFNKKRIHEFKNQACANMYLKVWFGEKSMSSSFDNLKQKLLSLPTN